MKASAADHCQSNRLSKWRRVQASLLPLKKKSKKKTKIEDFVTDNSKSGMMRARSESECEYR